MCVCVLHAEGQVLVDENLRSSTEEFIETIAPYREGVAFVLGHALMRKAIHGGTAKNGRINALETAKLLRGGSCCRPAPTRPACAPTGICFGVVFLSSASAASYWPTSG